MGGGSWLGKEEFERVWKERTILGRCLLVLVIIWIRRGEVWSLYDWRMEIYRRGIFKKYV